MLAEAPGTAQIPTALTLTQLLTCTIFVRFYLPCASTTAAMSRELGWKGAAAAAGFALVLALILGLGKLVFEKVQC